MADYLIAAHVVAALLLLGPITVAASRFPRQVRQTVSASWAQGQPAELSVAEELHRITRGYAALSVAVPGLGIGVASYLHLFTQRWLVVAMLLTAAAAGVLAGLVVPAQAKALALCRREDLAGATGASRRAAMSTGAFSLLWVAIAVLMVTRPRLGQ